MLVGVGTETNFLQDDLCLLGLQLAGFLLLLVLEFRVVDDAADRRSGSGLNLNKVEILVLRHFPSLVGRINTLFDIVADESYLAGQDFLIDFERLFHLLAGHVPTIRSCYGLVLLLKKWRGMRFGWIQAG